MKINAFLPRVIISVITMVILAHSVSAETITPETSSNSVKVNSGEVQTSTKAFGNSIFQKVDTWRAGQEKAWSALKLEKQEEVKVRDEKMDQGLVDRTNRVLEGEQASVVQGSVKDFDGNIFLLKIYIAAISLFVLIFSYPIVFYAVIIFLTLTIVHRIYQRVRYGM